MLILNILLRITGFTQEELANYVGISRASINSWLSDDSNMSDLSKRKIADTFGFPAMFFNYDLNQDIELYKIIYSTIYNNWNKTHFHNNDRVKDILNEIETDFVPNQVLTDDEIIESLIEGCNPFTGEAFEDDHILNDNRVKMALMGIKRKELKKFGVNNISKKDLSPSEKSLFEDLRQWRKQKTQEEDFFNAYMVFTDKELINIIKASVNGKNDLLNIKGIGQKKYEKYGDEVFSILCSHQERV